MDVTLHDRAVGALLGLAVGDALGTTLEFQPRDRVPWHTEMTGGGVFGLRPGEWTDDTSMALCLAESLLAYPEFDAKDAMGRWDCWRTAGENSCTGTCFDIGNQTRSALIHWRATGDLPAPGPGAGNGGIMRLAPAVIRWHSDGARAEAVAARQSAATHANDACDEAARVFARLIHAGLHGGMDAVAALLPAGLRDTARTAIRSTGYVVDTLEAAQWCVAFGDGFEAVVTRAVNLGDDADTVGAVTGQLAGAIWGASAIPERWLAPLAWRERIVGMAEALVEADGVA